MQTFKGVNGLLFVHDPKINCIVWRPSQEELTVYSIYSVNSMHTTGVKQFGVLINFPEDNLVVHRRCNHTVSREPVDAQNFAVMAIVSVEISHFPQVPHLERPVFWHGVEWVIFFIELYTSDRIAMSKEALDLSLIVDIPNADQSIFTSWDQVLAVWRNCTAKHFIVVTFESFVKLLASEKEFLFWLQIP